MKITIRRAVKWTLWGLAALTVMVGLYLSLFFFPYPLFPHHAEIAGFSVWSDREIPEEFVLVLDDARRRVEAMELYSGEAPPRIFVCRSQRLFRFFIKMAGKRFAGQGLLVSVAGNAFFSSEMIETIGSRNGGRFPNSRLEGSWAAAIAHEVAHYLVFSELGFRKAQKIPIWKSEGYADYSANLLPAASDPDYDFRRRIEWVLNDDLWQGPVGSVNRRHVRWQVLVEFLCGFEGLNLRRLLDDEVTEERAWADLMEWYSVSGTTS